MPNNIDGVKKISKKKLKNSRQLVLDAISEKPPKSKPDNLKQVPKNPPEPIKTKPKTVNPAPFFVSFKKKNKPSFKKNKPIKDIAPDFKVIEDEIDKKELIKTKIKLGEEKQKLRKKIEKKVKTGLSEKKEKNIKKKTKTKKKELQEIKNNLNKIKKRLSLFFLNFSKSFRSVFLKSIFYFLAGFLSTILIYLVFVFAVIFFNIDSYLTRYVNKFFPIPALVSSGNFVDYYQYLDYKQKILLTNAEFSEKDIKTSLLKQIVLNSLAKKYKTNDIGKIKKFFTYDKDLNQVAFKRILKIKKMIKNDSDFVKIATKYGDEQGKIDYKSVDDAVKEFGESIKFLKIGEVSDILYGKNGYYIIKRYEKGDNEFSISYVFVESMKFEDFLNQSIVNLKIWSII